jgi:hypothetical protein
LNSRVNCLLSMTHLLFHKTPNSVSSEPGAAQKLDPGAECSYSKFTLLLQSLIANGLSAELDDSSGAMSSASSTTGSSAASAAGLPGRLCFEPALAGLSAQARSFELKNICGPKAPRQPKPTLTKTVSTSVKTTDGKTETTNSTSTTGGIPQIDQQKTVLFNIPNFGPAELRFVMRSPVGVFNYLGTFLRDGPFFMSYYSGPAKRVLSPGGPYLDIVPSSPSGCYTSLNYMGQSYCVPAASLHTPMIMDMVETLRNLNIQPADVNSAFTVRLSP